MKKQMTLALGLAVISGSALASKARLEALGENGDGSQYIMDARNIFLNPAQANYFKDMVTVEAGNTQADTDSATSPNAEGGFLRASGNMVYGVFLGHEDRTINVWKKAANTSAEIEEQNTWDFFVAGDAGVQWGANLTYAAYKNDQTANAEVETSTLRANVGVISGDTEVFLRTSLTDTAEIDNSVDFEVSSRFVLGASHNWDGGTFMLTYSAIEAEESETLDETWKDTTINLGYGKVTKLNDSASFNWKVNYMDQKVENRDFVKNNGDEEASALSVAMGVEVMTKEWLTLRAGISQNITSTEKNDDGDEKTADDSTVVTAGASFIWGDFQVDGMIGNTNGTTTGENTSAGNGTLRTDSLLSRVSATYRF